LSVYHWIASPPPADPGLAADLALGFADRDEAEDWLGACHADLRAAGVQRVALWLDDQPLWGPMELDPAG
jgi:hypothetical protein